MNTPKTQTDSGTTPTPVPIRPPAGCAVGLDWADQKHCVAVRDQATGRTERRWVDQKPQAVDEFVLELRARYPQGVIALGLEQSRGPVIYSLMKYDFLVLYPVNPLTLASYRQAFKVSGAKSDPPDAELIAELVALHSDRLRPLNVQDPATRKLVLLNEHRRDLVEDSTCFSNRLCAALKNYYPVALEVLGDYVSQAMGREFLRKWPTLQALQKAKPQTLRKFFHQHNSRSEERIQERLELIKQAKPLTEDPALVEPLQFQTERLVAQLETLSQAVADYDQKIAEVFATHSEASLFESLPGAGPVLAPRLAALFGTMRENFASPNDLLQFTGVAPVEKQSGQKLTVHFRRARPVFAHQSIVEFANCSIGQCEWAKLVYKDARAAGKSHWQAVRKLAFKWLRILWRCWQDRQPYDEIKYLRTLQGRGVKLFAPLYEKLTPVIPS